MPAERSYLPDRLTKGRLLVDIENPTLYSLKRSTKLDKYEEVLAAVDGPPSGGWMKLSLMLIIVVILCFQVGYSNGAENSAYIEILGTGSIDWAAGVFQSRGVGSPPEKKGESDEAEREKVFNASKAQALKNMLALVMSTRIDAHSSVRDIASRNDMVMAKVESLINGSKVSKQEYLSDGTVEISLQMNMFGGFAQLILPEEIKQIEAIKTVSGGGVVVPGSDSVSPPVMAEKGFTGLVVDARGTRALPVLVPVIVDENGKEVYGPAFVSREFAVQQGLGRYTTDTESAFKSSIVGNNPLLVKGLRAEGNGRSRVVISNADASRLLNMSENLSFLKKCRVVIVLD